MNEWARIGLSFRDYFSKPMLRLVVLPFVISGAVVLGLFFFVAEMGLDALQSSVLQVQSHSVSVDDAGAVANEEVNATYTGSGVVQFLLSHRATSWMVSFFVYALGTVFAGMVSIYIALMVVGFLTPKILRFVRDRHYPDIELKGYGNLFVSVWVMLKNTLLMLLLFLLLSPLYLIPFVNLIALNYPLFYLFRRLLEYDITGEMMTKTEFEELHYRLRKSVTARMGGLYLLSLIPFLGLVMPVFYVIYLGHGYFAALSQLRKLPEGTTSKENNE